MKLWRFFAVGLFAISWAAALGKLLLASSVAELQVFGLTEKNAFTASPVAGGQIDYGYFSCQPGDYANVTLK